jgi:predicted neutral ceramidase superfamily lipid hydrolase
MRGQLERWYPLISGLIVAVSYFIFFRNYPLPASLKDLLSAVTNLSGIAIGFLAAAQSILFSLPRKYVIQQLKATGMYNRLINYFIAAIQWSFGLAVLSAIGLLIDFSKAQYWHSTALSIWLFFLITALLSYYRVIQVFVAILRAPD